MVLHICVSRTNVNAGRETAFDPSGRVDLSSEMSSLGGLFAPVADAAAEASPLAGRPMHVDSFRHGLRKLLMVRLMSASSMTRRGGFADSPGPNRKAASDASRGNLTLPRRVTNLFLYASLDANNRACSRATRGCHRRLVSSVTAGTVGLDVAAGSITNGR